MYIIGTAGHVDHGKSTLVKALTGVDPDRLPAEKERALTIVLGFASYLNADGQRIGIIDVPGHERFIRNMVGGVWSLDLALLIVASDDGWMEQTEDHTSILKAMGVKRLIAVITKADLVDADRLHAVRAEIEGHIGTIFGHPVPIITTSCRTGEGLDALLSAIDASLASGERQHFPPALAIDRSFLIDGIGAVATGSLRGMNLAVGDPVTILPSRQRAKVKALESFAQPVTEAGDGSRIAISLQGVAKEQLAKGSIITLDPSFYTCAPSVHLLITAIWDHETLTMKRIGEVEIASLTWHDRATLHIHGPLSAPTLFAHLTVEHARPWYAGEPVVLIRSGSATVLAAGTVVTARELTREQQRQIGRAVGSGEDLDFLLRDEDLLTLSLTGWAAATRDEQTLRIGDETFTRIEAWYIQESLLHTIAENLYAAVKSRGSVPLETFKQESGLPAPLALALLRQLETRGEIVVRGANIEAAEQEETLSGEEQALLEKIEERGFEGYPVKWLEKKERPAVGTLRQKGHLVFIESTSVYTARTFFEIASLILTGKAVGATFTIAEAKEHLPVSRKYMLPLLNALEERGFVRRIGDQRQVIKLPEA
ncbi:MAG TPA: selenocysteine-specific translation elongation factor [Sphaerochaeta sp.]|nr:selenocysteine-specific translation elongation factor [Sphaerochaeta sp.]HOQ93582.1 selenocysteine-specific translation elongation factor [Sphaerochaeta sp.]HPK46389.1 selenocysteine-specific translation elongation factor [Sphaerochaeta sp.]